jgi:hypothetical protein
MNAPIRLHVGRLGLWKKDQQYVLHVQSAVDAGAPSAVGSVGGCSRQWVSGMVVGGIGDVVEVKDVNTIVGMR